MVAYKKESPTFFALTLLITPYLRLRKQQYFVHVITIVQIVFKRCLKMANDGAETMSAGRSFHTSGATASKARSPIVGSRVRRTTHAPPSANRQYKAIHR